MFEGLEAFHFLRPTWLLLGLPMIVIWWFVRNQDVGKVGQDKLLAPHLFQALTSKGAHAQRVRAVDTVLLAFLFMVVSSAGPTWSKQRNPFSPPTPPAVIVLEVSSSMENTDIQPTRLERAKHKVRDLAKVRAGAETALIAFDGTSHLVLPLTDDPSLFIPFLEGLEPGVMPRPGQRLDEALRHADQVLQAESEFGGIVVIGDSVHPEAKAITGELDARGDRVLVALPMNTERSSFSDFRTISLTPDDSDVKRVELNLSGAFQAASIGDDRESWEDKGRFFLWPALLIALFWFRRGWTSRWNIQVATLLLSVSFLCRPHVASADSITDSFFTPDQQGRYFFEKNEFGKASELFRDPIWKGVALFEDGKYEEAADAFRGVEGTEARINEGIALFRGRSYEAGLEVFKQALKESPSNETLKRNVKLGSFIVDYVLRSREQSGIGEREDMGADDIKFDLKRESGGKEQRLSVQDKMKLESAEKWMRSVNTEVKDFLALKFAKDLERSER